MLPNSFTELKPQSPSLPPSLPFFLSFHFLLLFKYSCLHFHPTMPPTPPVSSSHPRTYPLGVVHVSFIHVPWWSFPYFPPLSLSPIPSDYCQFVLNFNASSYILLACLFCWLGFTYTWDHMVFVFHCLAYFTYHNALQIHPCWCKG